MNFSSDTAAPAHPKVLEALAKANEGMASSYGADPLSSKVKQQLTDLFETDIECFLISSGTAANALALATLCRPDESIFCHREAHIERDERSAPEFYTGGGKLVLLDGPHGKIDLEVFKDAASRIDRSFVHETPASTLSLTNLTECGTAYSVDEIKAFCDIAHAHHLSVHLDGARLSNALVSQNASPAEMTWKAGVDILTFGFTKNGAMACEAIVLFGKAKALRPALEARAKRGGHLTAKMRFLAAQASALLEDQLYLDLARHANAMAERLSRNLLLFENAKLSHPCDGNEVFVHLQPADVKRLHDNGGIFYPWIDSSHRFVTHWQTCDEDIDIIGQLNQ